MCVCVSGVDFVFLGFDTYSLSLSIYSVGYSAREHPSYIPQHVTQICANQMKPSGAIVILNMATRHRAHLLDHPCEIVFWNFLVHTELSATTLSSTATNTTAGSTGKPYNSAANGATIAGGSSGSGSRTEARWVVSVGSDQVLRVFEIASSHSHSSSSIPSSGRIGSGGRGGTDYAKAAGGSAAMKSKSQSSVPSSPATTTTDPMQDALVNEWLSKSQLVASYSLSWKVTCLVVCSEQPTIFLGDENGEIATYRLVYDRKSAELVQVLK